MIASDPPNETTAKTSETFHINDDSLIVNTGSLCFVHALFFLWITLFCSCFILLFVIQ